jgi:MoaA/NifB/PqqE/SkfB family radical SAM enzyme
MVTLTLIATRLNLLVALLPLLNLKKLSNLAVAALHFLFRSSRTVKHPPIMILTLTSGCNYKCIMCLRSSRADSDKGSIIDYRHPKEMNFDSLRALLVEHANFLCMVRLHGGEPLHYSKILEVVDLLNELRIPYTIVTNGALLTDSLRPKLVDQYCVGISISIDAATEETYRKMRKGGDLKQLLSNIDELNNLKAERRTRRPVLNATMCTFSMNAPEMPDFIRLCKLHQISAVTVGEGWDYDTPHIQPTHLVENNKALVADSIAKSVDVARQLGVTLRTRFPSLQSYRDEPLPRQRGIVAPKNCLNLYASVWVLPEFDAIGCSGVTATFGKIDCDNFQRVWNDESGCYAQARRSLRDGEVPAPCSGCIYTGGIFS